MSLKLDLEDDDDTLFLWTLKHIKEHAETKMESARCVTISIKREVFGHACTTYLSQEDIMRFYDLKDIGQVCITLYMR